MRTYRIVEISYGDGHKEYRPEFKFLIFWHSWTDSCDNKIQYNMYDSAVKHIMHDEERRKKRRITSKRIIL